MELKFEGSAAKDAPGLLGRWLRSRDVRPGVHVRAVQFRGRRRLARLRIRDDQKIFLPSMRRILSRYRTKRNAHEFVIEFNGLAVGYFQLNLSKREIAHYAAGPTTCGLEAMCIDQHWQGQGIAVKALASLPTLVNSPISGIRRVNLTVDCDTRSAIRVYQRAGFVKTGNVLHLAHVAPQYVMSLELNGKADAS